MRQLGGKIMTDISKCIGEKDKIVCPLREKCYRFTSPADQYWQSWIEPELEKVFVEKDCFHFWEIK